MEDERLNRTDEVGVGVPETSACANRQTWQKPELEKLPLNEAQTGGAGLSDSDLFS